MPIHFLGDAGPPGDVIRQQWLSHLQDDREVAPAPPAHNAEIAFPGSEVHRIRAAHAWYQGLWSRVRHPGVDISLMLSLEYGRHPLQKALAQAEKAFGEVVNLQHSIARDKAFGPGTEARLVALDALEKVCGELEVALDEVHLQLQEHIEGPVCRPRLDLRSAALALLKLCGAMALVLLAIALVVISVLPPVSLVGVGLACGTALSASLLASDAVLTVVGEILRFRKSEGLPAALHLYPNHRETLRAWASGIRKVCANALPPPSAAAAGPQVALGPA